MSQQEPRVSANDFVMAWQQSESIEEVMGRLKMTKTQVYQRARNYKMKNVPLKEFSVAKRKSRLDLEALRNLAEQCLSNAE
jgi:23S rRNA maturation mini-RNase III